MSIDKQIEEMAKAVCIQMRDYPKLTCKKCKAENRSTNAYCRVQFEMERLYNAGYRKAEEIFADLDKTLGELAMKYSDEGFNEYFGVCEEIFTKVIYPIRKKYTVTSTNIATPID